MEHHAVQEEHNTSVAVVALSTAGYRRHHQEIDFDFEARLKGYEAKLAHPSMGSVTGHGLGFATTSILDPFDPLGLLAPLLIPKPKEFPNQSPCEKTTIFDKEYFALCNTLC